MTGLELLEKYDKAAIVGNAITAIPKYSVILNLFM